jgi:aryl-phospho-beta-D-glucosidase BglC (GH1 family)
MFTRKKRLAHLLLCFILLLSVIGSSAVSCSAEEITEKSLSDYDLSDFSNWTSGYYTNNGPKSSSAYIRTLDYLNVDSQDTYSIELSNTSFSLSIYEYASDYSFITSNSYTSGAEFSPTKNTFFAGLYLKSSSAANYSAYKRIFENGVSISLNTIDGYDDSITSIDFTNTALFKKGKYIKKGSGANAYAQCSNASTASLSLYDTYKTVDPVLEYIFTAPNDDYKLCLVEQSDSGTALSQISISSGYTYTPSVSASGVSLSIVNSNPSYTVEDIKNDLSSGAIGISVITIVDDSPNTNVPPEDDDAPLTDPSVEEPIVVEPPTVSTSISAHAFVNDMRAGWNLGNTLDAHAGDINGQENLYFERVYGNVMTSPEIIQYVADCGFDTIRIPVSWCFHTYTDADGHYHIYESWLSRVAEIVNMSFDAGLNVILNTHHDYRLIYAGCDDDSFTRVKIDTEDLWTQIAEYFKDYDDRLLFESFNELQNKEDGSVFSEKSASQCNELNQLFVNTVRATGGYNSNRLLIVPTLMDKYATPFFEAFTLPEDSSNDKLIIEIHMYTNEFDQSLEYTFDELEQYSNQLGAPIIIGEYGYQASYSMADRALAYSNYVSRAASHGIKTIVWDNGKMSDYGLINRSELDTSNTNILNAIVNAVSYNGTEYSDITSALKPEIKLTQSTGAIVVDVWWGSMVASSNDFAVPFDSQARYIKLKCINKGDAFSRNIHYVDFYDADGNTIKMYSKGYPGLDFYVYPIPKGAAKVNICLQSSKYKTTKEQFLQYIADGNLKLLVGYIY